MGELLLCDRPIAAMPFYLEGLSVNVYSLEELNYYILNNTFLLDSDFMSNELCEWIRDELKQPKLAEKLERIILYHGRLAEFVLEILDYTGYCTKSEKQKIIENVKQLEEKSDFECSKMRADKLMENGKYLNGIYEYKKLLESKEADGENEQIKAKIIHNLGTAYARLFLFDDAAKYYRQAYLISHDSESLKECLLACICMHDNNAFRITADEFGVSQEQINNITEFFSQEGRDEEITSFDDKLDNMAAEKKADK
ncbi:MAG: hypothetical protein EGR89_08280, partial [[Eubacterium] rectale]|nr:hypothetical protein [Agathobacter rectalis]